MATAVVVGPGSRANGGAAGVQREDGGTRQKLTIQKELRQNHVQPVAANLLNHESKAEAPNRR